jgi:hypothetical protein
MRRTIRVKGRGAKIACDPLNRKLIPFQAARIQRRSPIQNDINPRHAMTRLLFITATVCNKIATCFLKHGCTENRAKEFALSEAQNGIA